MTKIPADRDEREPNDDSDPADLRYRAQLLATEHWSLLASRSTTQNEVLVRIAMLLTVVSAGLLSLGIVGQATGFSDAFVVFASAVLGFATLVGVLTQVRVFNVALEDLMYVLAMNRLRAAYVSLDPGIAPFLMASRYDDVTGAGQTYYFLGGRSDVAHVSGSSMIFVTAVNSALFGLLAAAITATAGGRTTIMTIVGVGAGLLYGVLTILMGGRLYRSTWKAYEPRFPAPVT